MEKFKVEDGSRYRTPVAMVLVLLSISSAVPLFGQDTRTSPEVRAAPTGHLVELQTSNAVVNRGERMQVRFFTTQNVFVTILRIDTDGRVRILYPERPWQDSYVEAGRMLEVRNPACNQGECAFVIDDYPGQGYIFAIASLSRYDFDAFANGDYWAYGAIAHRGRVTGDPFVAVSDFMSWMIPDHAEGGSSFDVLSYHVGRQFDYPRFLCYECHTFVRYPAWDPYQQNCSRFQVVRYDADIYEPFGSYGDSRLVLTRPLAVEPRFMFEVRDTNDPFVTTRRERSAGSSSRGAGATARDVGGIGPVPAPLGNRGTASDTTLRWLSPLERAIRDGRVGSTSSDASAARQRPHLRRRVAAKPDTSGKIRRRPSQ